MAEFRAKLLNVFTGLQNSTLYIPAVGMTRSEFGLDGEEAKKVLLIMLSGQKAFPDMISQISLKTPLYVNNIRFECPPISNNKWDEGTIRETIEILHNILFTRLSIGFDYNGPASSDSYYTIQEKSAVHLNISTPDPANTFVLYKTRDLYGGIMWRIVYPVFDKRLYENKFVVKNMDNLKLGKSYHDSFFLTLIEPSSQIFGMYSSKTIFDVVPPPDINDLMAYSRIDFTVS
jgi:hypothetical protein